MRNGNGAHRPVKRMPRWPLVPIALPAAVAIWSGWVGLGALCGFGPVHVLPGINDGFVINTAICLPIGMEAYAAYALAVWLRPVPVPEDAKRFAKRSALGALGLGLFGQVAFHLLTWAGLTRAPVVVVVFVSCIPVAMVGLAAALVHLMSGTPEGSAEEESEPAAKAVPMGVPVKPGLPSVRETRDEYSCGPATEKKIRRALRARDAQWAQVIERSRDGAPAAGAPPAVPAAQHPAGASLNGHHGS